jgi:hypothetical protein
MRACMLKNEVRAFFPTHPAVALLILTVLAVMAAPVSAFAAGSAAPSFLPPSSVLTPVQAAAPYGLAVAISGDSAAVTGFIADRAVVFVFVRSAGVWAQQARIVDPELASPSSVFGSALALSGDTLAIGAGAESAPSSSVYVYARAAGAWSLQAHLRPARAATLGFGTSLALAGDTLVVGAPGSSTGSAPGAAHVYTRTGGAWTRKAILSASSPAAADRYGRAVGVAHQHVLVGGTGFAEVFDLRDADGTWQRSAVLHGTGTGDAGFGSSAAASNETLAVGDPAAQTVSLFIHTSAGWFHQADLTPPDSQAGEFGSAISLSQDVLEVGAPGSSRRHAPASGAAYVFSRLQRRWSLAGAFGLAAPAAGERFGAAVAVSVDTALVGATGGSLVPTAAWLIDGLDNP